MTKLEAVRETIALAIELLALHQEMRLPNGMHQMSIPEGLLRGALDDINALIAFGSRPV